MRSSSPARPLAFLLSMLSAFCTLAPGAARAAAAHGAPGGDVLGDINTVRTSMCAQGTRPADLQTSPSLNSAAQRVARGATPQDALLAAGYVAKRVASVHLQGYETSARLRQVLARSHCSLIGDPAFSDIGIRTDGDDLWLVLAAKRGVPGDADAVSSRVLVLVNDARSQQRRCGNQKFEAARPLMLNANLGRAALVHAQDMATHSFMEHQGHDGSTPAQRVSRAGYQWITVAENVAAGSATAEEVVASWLASPGHCANIMGDQYSEMGIAFAVTSHDKYGVYWTMSLAAPR
jgi:uncharacterized protein YkwD